MSVNLSKDIWKLLVEIIKSFWEKNFSKPRTFVNKKQRAGNTQAIRPTDMSRHTVNIDRDQTRFISLIWKKNFAS
jgi:DNA topoisomerase-1